MALRDYFWLWGHPEGVYNDMFGNKKASRMTPMECCLYLGIRNTFMVPVGVKLSMRQYNKSFKTLRTVGWECFKAARDITLLDPIIENAAEFQNIGCVVFDDFIWHRCSTRMSLAWIPRRTKSLRSTWSPLMASLCGPGRNAMCR